MTVDELMAEARHLERRALNLVVARPGERMPAAVWGGRGPRTQGNLGRHRLSVAPARLPPLADVSLPGPCLSLHWDDGAVGEETAFGVRGEDAFSSALRDGRGTPLIAEPAISLPPLDGIFRLGSASVRRWLAELDWMQNGVPLAYSDNFPDREIAAAYERLWQKHCPMYASHVFAVVGGWHFPWPDGDWDARLKDRLLLWTLAESEPWVELWQARDGRMYSFGRIT